METLSSTKLVPGAEKVGDCWTETPDVLVLCSLLLHPHPHLFVLVVPKVAGAKTQQAVSWTPGPAGWDEVLQVGAPGWAGREGRGRGNPPPISTFCWLSLARVSRYWTRSSGSPRTCIAEPLWVIVPAPDPAVFPRWFPQVPAPPLQLRLCQHLHFLLAALGVVWWALLRPNPNFYIDVRVPHYLRMCLCLEIGCLKKSLSIRSLGWTLIQHDPCPLRSWHTGTHRRRRVRMPPTSQGERSQKKHLVSAFHLRNWEKGTLCWLSHQVTGCELPPGGCVTSGKAVFLVEGRGSRLWAVSRQCFWQVLQAEGEWRRPATVSARMELVRVLRDSVHVTVSWDRVFFFFF